MADEEGAPPAPMTALAAAAVQMHELFRAYVEAGFTIPQAMQLICAASAAAVAHATGQQPQI